MKTIIFVTTKQLAQFDYDYFKRQNVRLVLVIGHFEEEYYKKLSGNGLISDDVIIIPNRKIYSESFLNEIEEEALDKIVAQEILLLEQSGSLVNNLTLYCADEGSVLIVAAIRSKYNINGLKYAEALVFRNKALMKEVLANSAIRIPKFHLLSSIISSYDQDNQYEYLVQQISLPFIIKPVDSAGSDNIFLIKDKAGWISFCDKANQQINFEVEEYIDGKLYHCDAVIFNNQLKFLECCEYTFPLLEFQSGKVLGDFILPATDIIRVELIEFAERCFKALKAHSGSYHMELFRKNDGEIIFLEVAARAPGLYILELYKKIFGINLTTLDIAAHLNLENKLITEIIPTCGGVIPKKSGQVIDFSPLELKSDYKLEWLVKQGDILDGCFSNIDFAGTITISNNDVEILRQDFETFKLYPGLIMSHEEKSSTQSTRKLHLIVVDPFYTHLLCELRKNFAIIVILTETPTANEELIFIKEEGDLDLYQFDGNYPKLINYLKQYNPQGVITGYFNTNTIELSLKLSGDLNIAGYNPPGLECYLNDKFYTLNHLSLRNIPVAKHLLLKKNDNITKQIAEVNGNFTYPLIVKPTSSGGSYGVYFCDNSEDLTSRVEELFSLNLGMFKTLTIEEKLYGTEYGVCSVSYQGHHHFVGVLKYKQSIIDQVPFLHYSEILNPQNDAIKSVIEYARDVLNALNYKTGQAYIEIYLTPEGPRLVEFNPRAAGGKGIVDKLLLECFGHNQTSQTILAYKHPQAFIQQQLILTQKKYGLIIILKNRSVTSSMTAQVINEEYIRGLPSFLEFHGKFKTSDQDADNSYVYSSTGILALAHTNMNQLKSDYAKLQDIIMEKLD